MSTTRSEIDVTTGTIRPRTFRFTRTAVIRACKLLFGMTIEGEANVPKMGAYILVSNHLHNLDPVFTSAACPRPVQYMAKVELFKVPVLRRIIRWVGAFPINRGKMDREAIRHGQAVLKAGYGLGIFPEGTRSLSMKIERVLPGAGLFALKDDVTIVPCAITGSERLPFNGAKQHRGKGADMPDPGHKGVRIRFGEAFTIPAVIDGKRANAEAATHYMMERVAALLPEPYRGIYGVSNSEIIEIEDE
jgi:1-acyl-sn-glycerol-3-phosphate acyltransferase